MEATLGGTRRYLQDVARACTESAYENGLAFSFVRADAAFRELERKLTDLGWATFEIPMRRSVGLHDAEAVAALRNVIRAFEPDLIHAHSSKAGALSRLAAFGLKRPIALAYTPNAIAVNLSPVYDLAERALAPLLDVFVAVGPSEKRELESLDLLPSERIPIVVPTIDGSHFQPFDRDRARHELGLQSGPTVVAIGRLTAQKDPAAFVKFLAALRAHVPGVRAIWVGDGELRDDFQNALAAAGLRDSVTITGWVNDVRRFIAAADLFVSTSAYESFGYVTAEAAASALPIVASAITGTFDIVTTDIDAQLYPAGNVERAANLAARFLSNGEFADLVGLRNRAQVLTSFAPEITKAQLGMAYDLASETRLKRSRYRCRKESIV